MNGLRDGGRWARSLEILARAPLPLQLDFARLYASLHKAVAPEPSEVDLVLAAAAFVWRVKRRMENRVRSPRFKAQVAVQGGRLPPPLAYATAASRRAGDGDHLGATGASQTSCRCSRGWAIDRTRP